MSLRVESVSKKYHQKKALDNISITFEKETIYGLLGRNGAGKSTLLNIINNRSFATSGSVQLAGETVTDNETADWSLAEQMLSDFDLDGKKTFKKLSTGYRSIAKLIVALSVPCEYIFLDEPVLGLDANHRELFYTYLIETYQERPRTFVISTHLIEEIANLLEDIIIIDQGKLIRAESIETILKNGRIVSGPKEQVERYTQSLEILGRDTLGGAVTAYVYGDLPTEKAEVQIAPLNLQTYFVQLTNRKKEK
ncbi:ATP-binding cassette domain-containing protein [Enterococcus faecalis]|uniref:ATP-binding cassette domain-containing protein n=1 Tax=Enterococcus faecalis TaxID=1351 RepID=UPI004041F9CA